MHKPLLVMDQHFRKREELFSAASWSQLASLCNIIGGENFPLPNESLSEHLEDMSFLVAAEPCLDEKQIERARNLKAIIEVSGAFQDGLDYQACFNRGIEVLSCAPGFRHSVAEMTVAMMLAGARGLVQEHERCRSGSERWLEDNEATDFSLYNQSVGFIGFGSIARECCRLITPFNPTIRAFDPWVSADSTGNTSVELCDLHTVMRSSRCIVIAASPTDENWQLVGEQEIAMMQPGALVLLISRSHLVDFDALVHAAHKGYIRVATDVFPVEPLDIDDPVRSMNNIILSPHRAAAVGGGRHPIGNMIVNDIGNMLADRSQRQLQQADIKTIDSIIRAPYMRLTRTV